MNKFAFIELRNCLKKYGTGTITVWANKDLSFDIEQGELVIISGSSGAYSLTNEAQCMGELVIILGSSGVGKSTLLDILGGMENVTREEIIANGNNIANYSTKGLTRYRRNEVGFVFQFYNSIPSLTAKENVELASELVANLLDAEVALREVGFEKRINNFPSRPSGGEQQRVVIACAIVKNPALLLCDESTGVLDYQTSKKVPRILQDRSLKKKSTVIIMTHNVALASIAGKVVRIQDGKIEQVENNAHPRDIEKIEW